MTFLFTGTILKTGMPLGDDYPYTGVQAGCKSPLPAFIAPKLEKKLNRHKLKGDEELLKNIISQEGPVAVAVWVSDPFDHYESGIFFDPNCPGNCEVNHAMVVVGELKVFQNSCLRLSTNFFLGYGSESGQDYWLVR